MATIAKDNDVVTLINVFTVAPHEQQRLVEVLVDATQSVMRKQPGFVSANIHRSLDGRRVTNYAQWRSREAFEAMLQNQEAAEHMGEAAKIAERFEPHLYEVSSWTRFSDDSGCVSREARYSPECVEGALQHHEPTEDLLWIGPEVGTQEGMGFEPSFGIAHQHPAHGHSE
jgi:quinol monooxygenase YgiN